MVVVLALSSPGSLDSFSRLRDFLGSSLPTSLVEVGFCGLNILIESLFFLKESLDLLVKSGRPR